VIRVAIAPHAVIAVNGNEFMTDCPPRPILELLLAGTLDKRGQD
jgi:hypothetical protein